ncbi:hypothetical protein [Streptomyces lomondensis]|nr:hypothetical protein [Streptomyces lomondensis]
MPGRYGLKSPTATVRAAGGEQEVAGVLDDADLRLGRAQHHQHRQRQQH